MPPVLPVLPTVPGPDFAGPTASCNWVVPGHILAGAYPADVDDSSTNRTLSRILAAGVTTFVCLQAEFSLQTPESVWRSGQGLRPYIRDVHRLRAGCAEPPAFVHVPIVDGGIAPDVITRGAVEGLARRVLSGQVLYVHCWGGHGRTGLVAALLLGLLYPMPCDAALKFIQCAHDRRLRPQGAKSPQTSAQIAQVKRLYGRGARGGQLLAGGEAAAGAAGAGPPSGSAAVARVAGGGGGGSPGAGYRAPSPAAAASPDGTGGSDQPSGRDDVDATVDVLCDPAEEEPGPSESGNPALARLRTPPAAQAGLAAHVRRPPGAARPAAGLHGRDPPGTKTVPESPARPGGAAGPADGAAAAQGAPAGFLDRRSGGPDRGRAATAAMLAFGAQGALDGGRDDEERALLTVDGSEGTDETGAGNVASGDDAKWDGGAPGPGGSSGLGDASGLGRPSAAFGGAGRNARAGFKSPLAGRPLRPRAEGAPKPDVFGDRPTAAEPLRRSSLLLSNAKSSDAIAKRISELIVSRRAALMDKEGAAEAARAGVAARGVATGRGGSRVGNGRIRTGAPSGQGKGPGGVGASRASLDAREGAGLDGARAEGATKAEAPGGEGERSGAAPPPPGASSALSLSASASFPVSAAFLAASPAPQRDSRLADASAPPPPSPFPPVRPGLGAAGAGGGGEPGLYDPLSASSLSFAAAHEHGQSARARGAQGSRATHGGAPKRGNTAASAPSPDGARTLPMPSRFLLESASAMRGLSPPGRGPPPRGRGRGRGVRRGPTPLESAHAVLAQATEAFGVESFGAPRRASGKRDGVAGAPFASSLRSVAATLSLPDPAASARRLGRVPPGGVGRGAASRGVSRSATPPDGGSRNATPPLGGGLARRPARSTGLPDDEASTRSSPLLAPVGGLTGPGADAPSAKDRASLLVGSTAAPDGAPALLFPTPAHQRVSDSQSRPELASTDLSRSANPTRPLPRLPVPKPSMMATLASSVASVAKLTSRAHMSRGMFGKASARANDAAAKKRVGIATARADALARVDEDDRGEIADDRSEDPAGAGRDERASPPDDARRDPSPAASIAAYRRIVAPRRPPDGVAGAWTRGVDGWDTDANASAPGSSTASDADASESVSVSAFPARRRTQRAMEELLECCLQD